MREFYRAIQHMAELTASGIMTMPHLVERLGPQRTEHYPALSGGAQRVLYQLDVRYERTAGLLEAYVDDERVAWVPVVTLRRPRG
jgi:hypothetical protein